MGLTLDLGLRHPLPACLPAGGMGGLAAGEASRPGSSRQPRLGDDDDDGGWADGREDTTT